MLQSCLVLCNSMDCSPSGFSCSWDSPGKNTRMSCHALLQGPFLTQGSNLYLFICIARQVLYHWCHLGSLHMFTHLVLHLPFPAWGSVPVPRSHPWSCTQAWTLGQSEGLSSSNCPSQMLRQSAPSPLRPSFEGDSDLLCWVVRDPRLSTLLTDFSSSFRHTISNDEEKR